VASTDTNYWTEKEPPAEAGAWRVEVSPAAEAASDRFLHVLTVMDETTAAGPAVQLVEAGSHTGVSVLDRMVLFSLDSGLLSSAAFDITGSGPQKVLVCDLAPGWWSVLREGVPVADLYVTPEGTCLYYQGDPGSYTLEPGEAPEGWEPPAGDETLERVPDAVTDSAVDHPDAVPDAAEEGEEGGGGGCGCGMVS